tara:strand:- start:1417 stop:2247 length:831 start_codon:yes stop_codon:yes gene_type:complete
MKRLKRHVFTHAKNIVVGGDVASFLYAFKNDYYVAFTKPWKPFFFEKFDTGDLKEKVWTFLYFQMMYRGKILGVEPNQTIRVEENILKIITEGNSLLNYKFEDLICFNPEMLSGISVIEKKNRRHRVVDKIKLSARQHGQKYHLVGDDFVKELHFDNNGRQKFIHVVSEIVEKKLNDFDFGQVSLRYKLLPILRQLGIQGSRNGKNKSLSLKLTSIERFIRPMEIHEYKAEEKIKFMEINEDDIWTPQAGSLIKKWSESFRWMDSKTTGNFRMHLT